MTESAPAALPAPGTIRARVIVFWVPLLWFSIPLVPACIFLLRFGCPRSALALGCYIGLGGAYLFTMFWLLLISAIAIGLGWMLMVDVSILQRVPMMLKVHIIMFLFAVATAVAPIWSIAGKATRYVRISRNGIDVGDNDAGLLAWPMIREVRQRGRFIMQFMLYDNRSIRVSSSVSNGWLLGELLQQHFPDFQPFAPSMPAAAVTGKPIERTSRPDQG